jgi:hypothetical protein
MADGKDKATGRFVKGNALGGRKPLPVHIRELARERSADAFATILDLMQNADTDGVRLSAAQEVLNRAYGKPPQAMTGEDGEGPMKGELLIRMVPM